MSEWFMGQEIDAPEMPANSPRPHRTPQGGVIATDVCKDGYVRRYLYKSMGDGDRDELLLSEIPHDLYFNVRKSGAALPVPEESRASFPIKKAETVGAVAKESFPVVQDKALFQDEGILSGKATLMADREISGMAVRAPGEASMGVAHLKEELRPRMVASPVQMGNAVLVETAPVMEGVGLSGIPKPDDRIQMAVAIQVEEPRLSAVALAVPKESSREISGDIIAPNPGEEPRPFDWSKKKKAAISVSVLPGAAPAEPVLLSSAAPSALRSAPAIEVKKVDSGEMGMNKVEYYRTPEPTLGDVRLKGGAERPLSTMPQTFEYPVDAAFEAQGGVRISNPNVSSGGAVPVSSRTISLSGATSFLQNEVPIAGLSGPYLGQVSQGPVPTVPGPGPVPTQQAAPAGEFPASLCPGAIQMPDGRTIEPEDEITLMDLCDILPTIMEALQLKATQGDGRVPVVGGQQRGFGPAGQMGAISAPGGGGGFGGGGGGGRGERGLRGFQGPAGLGGNIDTITKTDGDFTAGPGAFVSVPGTLINFTTEEAGTSLFFLQAVLGATDGTGGSQSDQLGLRIDGTDYPLSVRLLHTFAAGVGEFLIGQSSMFSLAMAAGAHTVEVVLRGLAPGEFGGTALGISATVAATSTVPLQLSVSHN